MSLGRKRLYSPEEYLDREEKALDKSEFYDGVIVAMPGGLPKHNQISVNVSGEARSRLKPKRCFVYSSDQRVKVVGGRFFVYPDVSIVCGEPIYDERNNLVNPKVVFEVLSPCTEKNDRERKFRIYCQIDPLEQYGLIAQDGPRVEIFTRSPGGKWAFDLKFNLDEDIDLTSIGIRIPLSEIYYLVEFPPSEPDPLFKGKKPKSNKKQKPRGSRSE